MSIIHFGKTIRTIGLGGNWRLTTYCNNNDPKAFIEMNDALDVTCQDCLYAMENEGYEWCLLCGEELQDDGECPNLCSID